MKTLVCITPQGNSRRLIDKGFEAVASNGGELHILYVQKGTDIFAWDNTPELLQKLFDYASEKSGIIHAICAKDVSSAIKDFIENEVITHIVLGAPPKDAAITPENVIQKIIESTPQVDVIILEREGEKIK